MKAVVRTEYGSPDVLRFTEVEKPTPKDDEVLIKVRAGSINAADWHILTGEIILVRLMTGGLTKPKVQILGADVAGVVEVVGKDVKVFQPGDAVFGDISSDGFGGYAEYVAVKEKRLVLKPSNLSFEEASAVPIAAITALQALRNKVTVQAGQSILVVGASGGVGTYTVQIAKAFGAKVTAVCSTRNLDMVRSLGADHVIDYTKEDFAKSGQRFDVIIAANGKRSLSDYRRVLSPNGALIVTGGSMSQIFGSMLLGPILSMFGRQKITNLAANTNQQDLQFLTGLLKDGTIKPIIDRCFPLSETANAFRYFGKEHARGKLVITMNPMN